MTSQHKQDKQNKETLVSLSDLGASRFIDVYYKVMDYQRNQIANFYRPISTVEWNGKSVANNEFQSLWNTIPASRHSLISVNAQPIPVLPMSSTPCIVITVNGTVSYLGSKPAFFSQTFIIGSESVAPNANGHTNEEKSNAQSQHYYVISDIFRLQQEISV